MAERVEPVHARRLEQQGCQGRQPDVDHQQDLHDKLRMVAVVVLGQRREFDVREGHLAAAHRRQDHQREHHDAHTADPRRAHAPELHAARQDLDVVENRGARGREARDTLEPGIFQVEFAAPDQVGEHPHDAGHEPRADDDAEPLLVGDLHLAFDEDQRKGPQQRRQQRREQQGIERRVHAADVGDTRRQQHERRDEEHHDADIAQNHIHSHCGITIWTVSTG